MTISTKFGTINDSMNISNTISASKARNNFYTLIEEVANKLKRFTITKRGQAQVVMMHPDEVASWEETMDILSDKKLLTDILKSEAERKSGRIVSETKLLKELGIAPKDLKIGKVFYKRSLQQH
ncbi:MAG: Prevent-host-death family protein [Candidatus Woesebacteria bacterium GW2011_GWC2_45_9]|uniref:Antitoxin n=2 Tax=Candidatus Woeseibacteriota TaxID=1752722 RepID=A0A0G1R5M0_9BACT|nr:MAG: Prevent-host-death family protein [Candidatus Woesebacteria bacterium GW2011_GWC2_45_9]